MAYGENVMGSEHVCRGAVLSHSYFCLQWNQERWGFWKPGKTTVSKHLQDSCHHEAYGLMGVADHQRMTRTNARLTLILRWCYENVDGGLICLGRLERASLNKCQSSWGLKDEYEGAKIRRERGLSQERGQNVNGETEKGASGRKDKEQEWMWGNVLVRLVGAFGTRLQRVSKDAGAHSDHTNLEYLSTSSHLLSSQFFHTWVMKVNYAQCLLGSHLMFPDIQFPFEWCERHKVIRVQMTPLKNQSIWPVLWITISLATQNRGKNEDGLFHGSLCLLDDKLKGLKRKKWVIL